LSEQDATALRVKRRPKQRKNKKHQTRKRDQKSRDNFMRTQHESNAANGTNQLLWCSRACYAATNVQARRHKLTSTPHLRLE